MNILGKLTTRKDIQEKVYLFLIFLIMCLAFSIPFGQIYARKLIAIISIIWLLVVEKEDILYLFKHKLFIALSTLFILYLVSLLWSEDVSRGFRHIQHKFLFIYAPILIFATTLKKEYLVYIITSFIFGMFINEILSYLIYFNYLETEYSKIHYYPVAFLNHIIYSVLVSFSAILILHQTKYIQNIYIKFIYIIFFITMTTNLVISSGRTGYIVYFVSLIIMLFTYYKPNLKNFFQLILFPIVIFTIGYQLNEDVQKRVKASFTAVEKVAYAQNYDTSFGLRLSAYPIAYDILSQPNQSFIFGMGVGNIKEEIKESVNRTALINSNFYHMHNSYLEVYVNTGIFGLLLFILIFYFTWKLNIKDREIKFIQQLFVITFTFSILSDVIFSVKEGMSFFAIFVSILIIQEKYEKKEIKCLK